MIIKYINKNKKIILFYIFSLVSEGIIMYFGNVPLDILLYIFVFVSFIGLIIVCFDYNSFLRKMRNLKRNNLVDNLNVVEKEYARIINELTSNVDLLKSDNKEQKKEMMEFYTMWVHQIKTPISAINLLLQDEDIQENETYKEIEGELFRIEQYVEMVLSYLRTESDTTDYVIKKCNIDNIVKQAVRKYAKQFIRKKIKIELIDLDREIVTDEKWLLFVIEQLFSNGLKYTNEGKISVYFNIFDELVIEDTGIGISSEDIPRIFENGYTGYNGRIDKKSTGIGLYLCKNILNKIGGSIRTESKINVGTKMFLNLKNEKLLIE